MNQFDDNSIDQKTYLMNKNKANETPKDSADQVQKISLDMNDKKDTPEKEFDPMQEASEKDEESPEEIRHITDTAGSSPIQASEAENTDGLQNSLAIKIQEVHDTKLTEETSKHQTDSDQPSQNSTVNELSESCAPLEIEERKESSMEAHNQPDVISEHQSDHGSRGVTCWKSYRNLCKSIVEFPAFTLLVMLVILANLVTLALYGYPVDTVREEVLDKLNLGFIYFFVAELMLRLSAVGFKDYFNVGFNIFDAFIILLSIIEQAMIYYSSDAEFDKDAATLKSFRAARILRVFRLANGWDSFLRFLETLRQTLKDLRLFLLLLVLFMYITAVCGMELYAFRVRFKDGVASSDGTSPRINFDTFPEAMTAMFALLTNDDWNAIMYDFLRACEDPETITFFVLIVIVGNFILLQLFLAILISTFDGASQNINKNAAPRRFSITSAVELYTKSAVSEVRKKTQNILGISEVTFQLMIATQ